MAWERCVVAKGGPHEPAPGAEARALLIADVDERSRAEIQAAARDQGRMAWWVTVRLQRSNR